METMTEKIKAFLDPGYGSGCGSGYGSGYGYGYGDGDGGGYGSGYGYGYGDGDGGGYGSGYGYGDGDGDGYGYGDGDGYGYGDGSGCGSGCGSGYGYGCGDGDGYGYGDDISVFDDRPVYDVDGIQTLIYSVKAGFAKGAILNNDMTLTPCFIAKRGSLFAHGKTIKEAVAALQDKLFEDMPEEERISAFWEAHPDKDKKYPARDLWVWHNRLTGSCEMGRNQFAKERGIDIDKDSFTVTEFCEMTRGHYGGSVIQKLEKRWNRRCPNERFV